MIKLRRVCAAAALTTLASGPVLAETTANFGIMSDYIFRGVYQSNAAAFGGIDIVADNGIYLGVWGAEVGGDVAGTSNGLEYDAYIGYVGGTENFSWNVGFTGYFYTDEFDDTYKEINLGFTVGPLDLQTAIGDYNSPAGVIVDPNISGRSRNQTYTVVTATFSPEVGPYYLLGRTDYKNIRNIPGHTGSKGMWFEIGKDFEIADGLMMGVAALYTPDAANPTDSNPGDGRSIFLSSTDPFAEFAITAHITKTITFGN
jgi:hypothetical protein